MLAKDRQLKSRTLLWIGTAFFAALLVSGLVIIVGGGGSAAVNVSARLSFLVFSAAYVGNPLAALFGRRFDGLARRGREFGLAFAAVLSVHLGLVVLTIERSARPFAPNLLIIAEIVGAIWIYALAVFSIARLRLFLSPAVWRRMRIIGMDYIALIFVCNFLPFLLKPLYLPFLVLAIGAIVLRFAAATRSRQTMIGDDLAHDANRLRVG